MTDPRRRTDGLGWVTSAVFPNEDVTLHIGRSADPPRPAEGAVRYAIVPSLDRARFLLPLASRKVTAASVLAYNALRPPRVRAERAALGTLALAGATRLAFRDTLTVSGGDLLVEHLAERLGHPRLHAAIGVRPPDPNHKPTLQLFDDTGAPRGYAKIGWNDATRALVRAEAAALRELPQDVPGYPVVSRLLADGDWRGQAYAIIEPLPSDVRGLPPGDTARFEALLAIARRGGPPATPVPFADTAYRAGLEKQAAAAQDHPRIREALDALVARHGGTPVEIGAWHGDWVPWNLGTSGGRLVAWDWEHSRDGVPVGFDVAHLGFQKALTLDGLSAAGATLAAAGLLETSWLDADQRRLVLDAYLVELWLRTWRLAAGGAGWNDQLHPALLDVLAGRR